MKLITKLYIILTTIIAKTTTNTKKLNLHTNVCILYNNMIVVIYKLNTDSQIIVNDLIV